MTLGSETMEIAVCIPAYNEEADIETVVRGFSATLPESTVYVYDNNSTDKTAEVSLSSGAVVRRESRQGKGFVVRRMLADVDADVYVIVDGDDTYDHTICGHLVDLLINNNLDMVVGARLTSNKGEFRRGHYAGNRMFSKLVSTLFSSEIKDVLSGYRVLSKRFVKSFPVSSKGFEIESEITIHCLELRLPFLEVDTTYKGRKDSSESKLSTFSDGFKILFKIILLLKSVRPLLFFGSLGLLAFIFGTSLFLPVLFEYFNTGMVPRFPTLIIAVGFYILSIIRHEKRLSF